MTFISNLVAVACIFVAGIAATCPPPLWHVFSSYEPKKYGYREGEKITYTCNSNHVLQGSAQSICLGGLWNSGPPRCFRPCRVPQVYGRSYAAPRLPFQFHFNFQRFPVNVFPCNEPQGRCPSRIPPQHGSDNNFLRSEAWYPGQTIRYGCNSGFNLAGHDTSICQLDGSWDHYVPKCISSVQCRHRDAPTNGRYSPHGQSSWIPGSQVTYSCNDNYEMVGTPVSICNSHGGWNHDVPQCHRIRHPCQHRSAPQYGSYTPTNKNNWYDGDQQTFSCRSGYFLHGDKTARCHNGAWNNKAPACKRKCQHRSAPTYGTYSPTNTNQQWYAGQHVTYSCENHFQIYGQGQSTCQDNGLWNNDVPRCRRHCDHRNGPQYGSYRPQNKRSWYNGDDVTYSCNDGYFMYGDATSHCGLDGRWNNAVPTCKKFCKHRDPPKYGSYTPADNTQWYAGQHVTYLCSGAYQLYGNGQSTCQDNGQWNNDVPVCRRHCNHREGPQYGSYLPKNKKNWYNGDTATYSCNDGYFMYGDASATCMPTGRWNNAVPTCKRYCRHRNAPKYGTYSPPDKTQWYDGQHVTYSCNAPWILYGQGQSTCGKNGQWNNAVPTCRRHCGHRDGPQYGTYLPKNKREWYNGDTATYSCNDGYFMYGDARSTCGINGRWNNDVPTCKKFCPHRNAPKYGKYSPPDKTQWYDGQHVTYSCNLPWILYGQGQSTCGKNGQWNNAVPTCRRHCNHRDGPQYGTYLPKNKREWYNGDTATYSCNDGYFMYGDARSTCGINGRWNNDVPTCKKFCRHRNAPQYGKYSPAGKNQWYAGQHVTYSCNDPWQLYGDGRSTCQDDGRWNNNVPTCRRHCNTRDAPQHGGYVGTKTTYYNDDTATFKCNKNYKLVGHASSLCQANGRWGTSVPTCVALRCTHRASPQYGAFSPSWKFVWDHNDEVQYSCNDGYYMVGKPISTCKHGNWDNSVPTCKKNKKCPHPTAPRYGGYIPTWKFQWNTDDTVSYYCTTGYTLSGQTVAQCQSSGKWDNPSTPTCHPKTTTTRYVAPTTRYVAPTTRYTPPPTRYTPFTTKYFSTTKKSTFNQPSSLSCAGRCGNAGGHCGCSLICNFFNNCCVDYNRVCY